MIKRFLTVLGLAASAALMLTGPVYGSTSVHPPTAGQLRAADQAAHVPLSCQWFTQEKAFPNQGAYAQAQVIQNSGCPGRKIEVVAYCLDNGGGQVFTPGNAVWVVGAISYATCGYGPDGQMPLWRDGVRISNSSGNFAGSTVIICWRSGKGDPNPADCPPGV